jgi:pimeloyl-ACP methyl ester carboxylesterase
MGGATALLAAESLPHVRAFVVDSAFARLDNVVGNSLASLTGLPPFPFSPLTIGFASLMTDREVGDSEPARATGDLARPVLIIHGKADSLVRPDVDAIELQRAAGENGELWLVPDADHVNARRYHPMEYEHRVLAFLAEHLGEDGAFPGAG